MTNNKKYWITFGITVAAMIGLLIWILDATAAAFVSGYRLNALDFVLSLAYIVLAAFLAWLTAQKTGSGIWITGILLVLSAVVFLVFGLNLHQFIITPVGIVLLVFYAVTGFPIYGLTYLFPADPWFFGYNIILFTLLLLIQRGVRKKCR